MSVQDARQRTKTYLDTYLTAGNLLKDDAVTEVSYITAFGDPTYPFEMVFYEPKNCDLVYCIFKPDTAALVDWDGTIYGYNERVPIKVYTVTKQGITGTKLLWQGEAELRRIVETYPLGSYRSLSKIDDSERDMGGWTLYSSEYVLSYERDTT
jgi:hypothetical protein